MSPDNMTSTTSIRKSNTSNQNGVENGRNNGNSTPPTTTTTTTFEGNNNNNNNNNGLTHHKSPQDNHQASSSSGSPSRSGTCLGGGGDMLLQWGPRKRSRCSRTEGRSMVSLVVEKHSNTTTNHIMPPPHPHPPSTSSNGSKSGSSSRVRPHALLFAKDTPAFPSSKNRNLVDQMGTNNASPSRNGGGNSRPISRSTAGKRSPSCIEKNDSYKKVSGTIRKVKSDDSLVPSGSGNDSAAHGGGAVVSTSTMVRSPVADAEKASEVIEWPRIYLSLSRKEKEDDFYAMKGTKLPHRPKKRPKAVDRALQYCFPGLWLSDLTRARYEVRERKSTKKPKRRGLKGLENMESDSE